MWHDQNHNHDPDQLVNRIYIKGTNGNIYKEHVLLGGIHLVFIKGISPQGKNATLDGCNIMVPIVEWVSLDGYIWETWHSYQFKYVEDLLAVTDTALMFSNL